ncbi:uncharacterized protein cobll1a isoform X2 [Danio aesculapii]|uniref:uncharacterized protein cobll1a isoform X2 n=1 Tax=Danio aesculapii TaxID=1142201 RepID=UPI0024C0A96D|nr:uncharacterized protein cobll1a isoform X2 [Danio aesculapii]
MDAQEDLLSRDITLTVLIPGGQETTATVHGSKPVMDVLVALCAQHHLVPSDHVIRLISSNQNHVSFKPNSMIGSLEFEKVVLQVKGSDANKKKPHIPVATVRLLINYKKSHKAVARVNPAVPLAELVPAVCEKCEFHPDATLLLRTDQSEEPLDLTKSLNDYGIRELYAKQIKVVSADPISTHKGADEEQKTPVKEKNHKEKANKGFFGLFKMSKKTSEQAVNDSAPASPELNGQCTDRVNGFNGHSLPTIPADVSKKRRAPQPPMVASQSVACELQIKDFPESDSAVKQGPLSRISSTESSLKRTKRRAPPPPCDGSAPSKSDNKEEAEGQDKSSDKHRAVISDRCAEFDKVMSEFAELLQEWQQSTPAYANSSASPIQPSESPLGLYSFLHTPEAELKALPGCQLPRKSSEREGLATFTVVPQRRQLSFELPFTSQTHQSPEHPQIHSTECVETQIFTNTYENERLREAGDLEENNQAGMGVKNGNLNERQYIHPELKSPERSKEAKKRLKRGQNLEHLDIRMSNLDLEERLDSRSLADWSSIDFHTSNVDQEEIEEPDLVESEEEKDWVEKFKERRMRFIGSRDDGIEKLDVWGRIQKEFTSTQVFWDQDSGENEEDMQIYGEDHTNLHLRMDSKPKLGAYSYYFKPGAQSTLTNNQPNSSLAKNNFSFTPEAHLNTLSSKPHSGFDPRPPVQVSLFALAVFQKAKLFKPVFDPSCLRRRELSALTHSN